jgi:hypothetical protein
MMFSRHARTPCRETASTLNTTKKYENLFNVIFAKLNMEPFPISLQLMDSSCKAFHSRAYTVPRSAERKFQQSKEIVRLVDIGVLEEDYFSKWASCSPKFSFTKKNRSSTVIVVTNVKKLKLVLTVECHPFPIPKIGEMIRSIDRFTFATELDLNIGYYHIKLDADAQKLFSIV